MAKPQEQDFPPAFTSSSLTAGPRSGSWREKPTPFPRRWGLQPAVPFRGSMKPAVLGDCLRLCLSAAGGLWGAKAALDQEREAPERQGRGGEAGPSGALTLFVSLVTGGCKGILVCPLRGPGALSPTVAGVLCGVSEGALLLCARPPARTSPCESAELSGGETVAPSGAGCGLGQASFSWSCFTTGPQALSLIANIEWF